LLKGPGADQNSVADRTRPWPIESVVTCLDVMRSTVVSPRGDTGVVFLEELDDDRRATAAVGGTVI
jgi:hypothetical protein